MGHPGWSSRDDSTGSLHHAPLSIIDAGGGDQAKSQRTCGDRAGVVVNFVPRDLRILLGPLLAVCRGLLHYEDAMVAHHRGVAAGERGTLLVSPEMNCPAPDWSPSAAGAAPHHGAAHRARRSALPGDFPRCGEIRPSHPAPAAPQPSRAHPRRHFRSVRRIYTRPAAGGDQQPSNDQPSSSARLSSTTERITAQNRSGHEAVCRSLGSQSK